MSFGLRLFLFTVLVFGTRVALAAPESVCELIVSSAKLAKSQVTVSQAQRLKEMLETMPPEKRQELYTTLSKQNLADVGRTVRSDKISESQKSLLDKHPGLDLAVQDLADFGGIFPGIFALANADMMVFKVLNIVRQQEVNKNAIGFDLLKSESLVPRLRRTIDNSLINLIEQAEMEYEGARFNLRDKPFQYYWYKFTRSFFPSYHKVAEIIDFSQEFEKQLTRIQLVDRLIIKLAISEAAALGLDEQEIESLTMQVLQSPKEVKEIEDEISKVLGQNVKAGSEAEIGHFDIRKSHQVTGDKDWAEQLEEFDKLNLSGLNLLAKIIDLARARKGMQPRTFQQFDLVELQLRYEAHARRMGYFKGKYRGVTAKQANESYTVEDRHTREVPDGTDKDGKTKYRTEVYYTDRTVHPSFENILSNSYDTGDRSVSGLDAVKSRANKMYLRELGPRNMIANTHRLIANILEDYAVTVTKNQERENFMKQLEDQAAELKAELKEQATYSKWSPEFVEKQYRNDDFDNFQKRNALMLTRMENAIEACNELKELMRRRQPQLTPIFDLFDYTNWLSRLRRIRNRAYTRNTLMFGTPISAAGIYMAVPEAQMAMDEWGRSGLQLIQSFLGGG